MKVTLLLIIVSMMFAAAAQGQIIEKIDPVAYENHQRAIRMKSYDTQIKSLSDYSTKCYLNGQIAKFIVDNTVTAEYGYAEAIITECLQNLLANKKEVPYSTAYELRNSMYNLLRQISPEKADQARKKYMPEEDTTSSDRHDISTGKNLEAIRNELLNDVLNGRIPDTFTFDALYNRSPEHAAAILNAVLVRLERSPNLLDELNFFSEFTQYFINEQGNADSVRRFLRLAIRLAQAQVMSFQGSNDSFRVSLNVLRRSLPLIQTRLPDEYDAAFSLYTVLQSRLSKSEKEREEIYERINSSKDKLSQTMIEAEATDDLGLKTLLWSQAARMAMEQKQFKLAVDCILKRNDAKPEGASFFIRFSDVFILGDVLPAAIKADDFEAADYALENIEHVTERAGGHLSVFSRLVELKRNDEAFARFQTALKMFEKAENTPVKIRAILLAVPNTLKLEESMAFELVREAIRTANRLPMQAPPNSEDKKEEFEYISGILMPVMGNLTRAFRHIAKADVEMSYSLANQLDSKAWKTGMMLIVETERKYPVPESESKTPENN